jgi:hypothetical protein
MGDIDVSNIDDLYVKINTISFEGTSADIMQQAMMTASTTTVKQVSDILAGKTVNLTTGSQTGAADYQYNEGVSMSTSLTNLLKQQANSYETFAVMQNTPMMKFYRQENGVYYGSLNPAMCAVNADQDSKQSCLAWTTQMLYENQ